MQKGRKEGRDNYKGYEARQEDVDGDGARGQRRCGGGCCLELQDDLLPSRPRALASGSLALAPIAAEFDREVIHFCTLSSSSSPLYDLFFLHSYFAHSTSLTIEQLIVEEVWECQ